MDPAQLVEVDKALLVLSEARERAESAARAMRRDGVEPQVAEAFEEADRKLLAIHGDLMRVTYFGAPTGNSQLKLAG